ncbi:hypothetical protein SLS62_006777 [Diatrype stigma]|uniref:Uncharacterized protein n=1 Tax=Diatrype stigma TaxID=117547 RepID=A0AAN9YQV6_9PEZI
MHQLFSDCFDRLNRDLDERGLLLDMLDRDLDTVIKCAACNKLHCALKTLIPEKSPKAAFYKCTEPPPGDYSIPTRITAGIARAIIKLHERKRDYQPLTQQINTSRTYVRDDGVLNQIAHIARVSSAGDLLLRTQQVWAMQGLDTFAVRELSEDPSDVDAYTYSAGPLMPESLCAHLNWGDQIHSICNSHSPPSEITNGIGYYDRGTGSTRLQRQDQYYLCPAFRLLTSRQFNRLVPVTRVTGCPRCQTDCQVELTRLPRPFGSGFLLTTWKNLGRGVAAPRDSWTSHDVLVATPPRHPLALGRIREQFDTAADGTLAARPGITASNLHQIHSVAREVERNGNGVALTHIPDKVTGLIRGFVPVDQDGFPAGS